jgi:hypothetical protein
MSDYCIENDGARRAELAAIHGAKAADTITEQAAEIERLRGFIEELRDYKVEIYSGRQHDPQDDVPDMMEAETFLLFQDDATALLNKEPTS